MKRIKSGRQLQRFVSFHDPIANLFNVLRHDISSVHHHELRATAMQMWSEIAHLKIASCRVSLPSFNHRLISLNCLCAGSASANIIARSEVRT